ncbi:hypothetical protein PAESOLCIP111_01498 [Paenibacillus solanacearum]|uniref:Uncharacterized protein n=1 Tax=Paenibacillus solanacearum TaxID=2048548 RepID=A0A916NHV1_9BACL|nr:hypothetical protein PAESOLCIP111_01498 [Paenibacillus solanacearum]
MKIYYASHQMRLVGKARDIRNYLQSMLHAAPADITLYELMHGKRRKDASALELIPLRHALDESQPARRAPHPLPYRRLQKTADRRAILFPSK